MIESSKSILVTALREMHEKHNLSWESITELVLPVEIPLSIFKGNISPVKIISKYLYENYNYDAEKISKLLGIPLKTIKTAMRNSKHIESMDVSSGEKIPLSEFYPGVPILIVVANYLKYNKEKKPSDIATILGRSRSSVSYLFRKA